MADTKISNLTAATTLDGTELVPVVQAGITAKATVNQIRAGSLTNPMTTAWDIIVGATGGTPARLPIGANGTALSVVGGTIQWSTVMTNPMTTAGDIIYGGVGGSPTRLPLGANGTVLGVTGGVLGYVAAGGVGTVTSVSVVSANGFAGTVATATTTPAITITTSVSGILKGNATAVSAATAGTDYSAGTSALTTGILKSTTGTGALSIAAAGTDYQSPIGTISGIAKGNGANALTAAVAGTDYLAPPSGTAILKANSGGALANATAGTDYSAGTSALATGVLKSTTTTGALSIAANSDLPAMSATVGGAVPTPPNDATKFLNGQGAWTVPAGGSGVDRNAPNFVNSGAMVAQRAGVTVNLTTSPLIGQCDNIGVWASGGAVSAGTITQLTTAISGTTGYAARAAGVTLTGSGQISHAIFMEAKDAIKYKNKTVSFSVKVDHDVGSNVNYTLVVKKPTVADTFSTTSTISTSGATAVVSATATTLTFNAVSVGDCSNGLMLEVQAACGAVTTKNFNCTEFTVEIGSTASSYPAANYEAELMRCFRYYFKIFPGATNKLLGFGFAGTASVAAIYTVFHVPMRVAPSALQQTGTANQYSLGSTTCTAVPNLSILTSNEIAVTNFTVSGGLTVSSGYEGRSDPTNGAPAYLAWSAELI